MELEVFLYYKIAIIRYRRTGINFLAFFSYCYFAMPPPPPDPHPGRKIYADPDPQTCMELGLRSPA